MALYPFWDTIKYNKIYIYVLNDYYIHVYTMNVHSSKEWLKVSLILWSTRICVASLATDPLMCIINVDVACNKPKYSKYFESTPTHTQHTMTKDIRNKFIHENLREQTKLNCWFLHWTQFEKLNKKTRT